MSLTEELIGIPKEKNPDELKDSIKKALVAITGHLNAAEKNWKEALDSSKLLDDEAINQKIIAHQGAFMKMKQDITSVFSQI